MCSDVESKRVEVRMVDGPLAHFTFIQETRVHFPSQTSFRNLYHTDHRFAGKKRRGPLIRLDCFGHSLTWSPPVKKTAGTSRKKH